MWGLTLTSQQCQLEVSSSSESKVMAKSVFFTFLVTLTLTFDLFRPKLNGLIPEWYLIYTINLDWFCTVVTPPRPEGSGARGIVFGSVYYLAKLHFVKYVGQSCLCVCLSVCLSVCSHSTGRIFTQIVSKLYQYFPWDHGTAPPIFGRNRPKVKVKVTENVKNTFLAITSEPIVLETSS